jgi:nitronate monooxygenase
VALRTALTELLGIEHPVIQAPMASAATPELVVAVSEAGGLGSLGSAMLAPDDLRSQVAAVREGTSKPFLLNFFAHEPPPVAADAAQRARQRVAPLYDEFGLGEPPEVSVPPIAFDGDRLEIALEARAAMVTFHFGLPGDAAVSALRDAGSRIAASATTVAEAKQLEQAGVDAVIAQGAEAGGHRGSFLVPGDDGPVGTLALVPQVADAVDLPVIAAGGIADGRGLAAVLALGAAGAQIGTAFLACPEAMVHPLHREALRAARAEGTTITRAVSGRPARTLRNRLTGELGTDPLPYPAQLALTVPLAQGAAGQGSADFLPLWAGQGAPLAREMGAAELVRAIAAGAERVLGSLGGEPD